MGNPVLANVNALSFKLSHLDVVKTEKVSDSINMFSAPEKHEGKI